MRKVDALYEKARRGLAEGDAGYWKAAEAMAELSDEGESQRAIGARLGCSKDTVRFYLAVWAGYRGRHPRPAFAEAMAEVRGPREHRPLPKAPERRAEIAAELIKDKVIYQTPAVQKAIDKQVNRELRQRATEFRKAAGQPSHTEQTQTRRRVSVLENRFYWRNLLSTIESMTRSLNEATAELERTGMPKAEGGDILRAARKLVRAAEKFTAATSSTAVGKPMGRSSGAAG